MREGDDVSAVDDYRECWEADKSSHGLLVVRAADAAIAELDAENERLRARITYLTVDCDEYVYKGGRCYRYEQDTICPREPRCHDRDRLRAERSTS